MASKDYGNYQQSNLNAYKSQFDGTAAKGGEAKADSTKAKQIGQQISTMVDRMQIDKSSVQRDLSTNDAIDLPRAQSAYASDIATLHNLERQYAAATGDSANAERLQKNSDQTGLGTTNQLLAEVGAKTVDGKPATDKDFTFTGKGSADGADSTVSAQLNGSSSSTQGTAGFQGSTSLSGSNSGGHIAPTWWGNGSAGSGGLL